MKKIFFNLTISLVLSVFILSLAAMPLLAATDANIGLNYAQNFGLKSQNGDVREVAVSIVRYLMTFLGIIATVVILLGGFRWMTAAGNEDKVAEAKKLLVAGVVGLIIILAAFAIVTFVVGITNNAITGKF